MGKGTCMLAIRNRMSRPAVAFGSPHIADFHMSWWHSTWAPLGNVPQKPCC